MSEEENEEEENSLNQEEYSLEEERQKLNELGVENTFNLLTTGEKKRKEPEKKPFRGFK
ncbi:MAG: hypothetical protein KGD58_11085 [Candidatus Lokiarchaeota archaeon]|nr:hypothetical protein [Candidatus Lokiarchaeota archaeon]